MKNILGLTAKEAEKRLLEDGENLLAEKKKTKAREIFLGQFKDVMVMILLMATGVSFLLGEIFDGITIVIIVILNALLGFIQEYRTEKTLDSLKKIAAPSADVYRDGKLINIPAAKLVRGDVIRFEAGTKIPADCKILEAMSLECDESMLTGESLPVGKTTGTNDGNSLNQKTVCYMGTIVTKGHGLGEIISTGKATQMGLVSRLLSDIEEEKTPLQKKLGTLGKVIGIACILICFMVSGAGILRGYGAFEMLFTGISLAVAAIPEGLPATVTISLALAVRRIYKQKAIVNKLHSVETLGCTNVICTDKTGTLTQNKMTVTAIYTEGKFSHLKEAAGKTEEILYLCGGLCNNAIRQGNEYTGDPTETALLAAAAESGVSLNGFTRISEIPFDSNNRFMSVTVKNSGGGTFEFLKGAVDVILSKCQYIMEEGVPVPIDQKRKKSTLLAAEEMAGKALRTLGFGYKSRGDYTFIGIIGMKDPLRPEVREAVRKCRRAGVRVIMLTGDHKNTAAEIARQAGIIRNNSAVITGDELSQMTDSELKRKVDSSSVFARVSPSDKLRIVRALKSKGNIVAMTGDGVNDAPAVKEAAIGVAMGITGTDVTKEAAQIVLLDDNFATLVGAIEQGRTIYDNIRKFIRYMLSCNSGEVVTMLFSMLLGMPVVLLPIQILLINLVTDGLPAIALSMEPPTDGIMSMPPRKGDEGIFSNGMGAKIIIRGIIIGIATLISFMLVFNEQGVEAGRGAALLTLALSQLVFVFECKDDRRGIFNADYFGNKKLILAVLTSLSILALLTLTTLFSPIFDTVPLEGKSLAIAVLCGITLPVLRGVTVLLVGKD